MRIQLRDLTREIFPTQLFDIIFLNSMIERIGTGNATKMPRKLKKHKQAAVELHFYQKHKVFSVTLWCFLLNIAKKLF